MQGLGYTSTHTYRLGNTNSHGDNKYIQGFVDTKTHIKGFGGYKHMYPRLEKTNTNINGLGDTNKHIQGLVDTNTRILCLDDISKYTRVRDTNTHIKCFGI